MNFVGEAPESDEEPVVDSESDEESESEDDDDEEDGEDEDDNDEDEDECETVDSKRFLFLSTARELAAVTIVGKF